MSASVGAAVDQIVVRKEAFTRPHSPVCVTFKPRLSFLENLVMDAPKSCRPNTSLDLSSLCLLLECRKVGMGCNAICQARPFMG